MNSTPEFHRLHVHGAPFILPCAWDIASARLFVEAGHRAVGTTSLGVAAGIGTVDEDRETLEAMADLIGRIATVLPERLLTCDFEDGYGDTPAEVVDILAERFVRPGAPSGTGLAVAGINIEDSTRGRLVEPVVLAAKITAIKDAFPDLFVNARIDTYWVGQDNLGEVVQRLRIYADAGADGVFVPGDLDVDIIEQIVTASTLPLNVLASPRFSRRQLAEAGVARISTGSLLYRAAVSAGVESLGRLNVDRPAQTTGVLSYRAVSELGE